MILIRNIFITFETVELIRWVCSGSEKDLKTDKPISFYTKKSKKVRRNVKRYKKLLSEKVAKQQLIKIVEKVVKKQITKIVLSKIIDKIIK